MGATGSWLWVPLDVACHSWGRWQAPAPICTDSAGPPMAPPACCL